ncbi:probable GH family 25 lysozyme 3 [Palaemon carinicauda]|uniref:probable GH family 25 lysozyme 3 n=1 Tax=Palaemon carinicauda TaxID=392227 RepID=UPI0035B5A1BF
MQISSPDSKMMSSTLLLLGCVLSIASSETVTSFAPLTSIPELPDVTNTSEVTAPNGESAAPIGLSGESSEALPSGDPVSEDPIPEGVSEGDQSSPGVEGISEDHSSPGAEVIPEDQSSPGAEGIPEDYISSRAEEVSFGDVRKSRAEEFHSGGFQRPWPYPGVLVRAIGGRVGPSISERFGRYEYAGNGLFRTALVSDSNIGGTADQTRTLGASANVRSSGSSNGSEDNESKFNENAEDSGMSTGSSDSPKVEENGPSESEPLGETSDGSQDVDSSNINDGVSIDDSTPSS